MITSHEFTIRSADDGDGAVIYVVGFRVSDPKSGAKGRSSQRVFRGYASHDFWKNILLPSLIQQFGQYLEIFDARSKTKVPAAALLRVLQSQ